MRFSVQKTVPRFNTLQPAGTRHDHNGNHWRACVVDAVSVQTLKRSLIGTKAAMPPGKLHWSLNG
jgi:hypothetical protein